MDLFSNPFYILGATLRDSREKIASLSESLSLTADTAAAMSARSSLTTPRKRLSAEIAWLPGAAPSRVAELISTLRKSPLECLEVEGLVPIAKANLLAAGLSRIHSSTPDIIVEWVSQLTDAFEEIDTEELQEIINAERVVSGFPPIGDLSFIDIEVKERRRHFIDVMKHLINSVAISDAAAVVTSVIEYETEEGEAQAPTLAYDLVNVFEVETHNRLLEHEEKIYGIIESIRVAAKNSARSDSQLNTLIAQLCDSIRQWDCFAQPMQVSCKSKGLDHEASHRVARHARDLAIEIYNEHDKLELSRQLTDTLQEVFAEVDEIAELTADDASTLEGLVEHHGYRVLARIEARVAEIVSHLGSSSASGAAHSQHIRELTEVLALRAKKYSQTSEYAGYALYVCGLCLQAAGEDSEALSQFESSIQASPNRAKTLVAAAQSFWNLKKLPEAYNYAEKAISADQSLGQAWSLIARIHSLQKKPDEALFAAKKSLDLIPSDSHSGKILSDLQQHLDESSQRLAGCHSPTDTIYRPAYEGSPKCEICGRKPAKHAIYRIHRGYVLVRSTSNIEGTFCRDHSVQAYQAAQKGNLTGMWFSAGSLLLGAASALWDSAKLTDLPAEVVDSPFVNHLFACPQCGAVQLESSGNHKCEKCSTDFNVGSCAKCGRFVVRLGEVARPISTCSKCSYSTSAAVSQRFSTLAILVAFGSELAALATPKGDTSLFFQRVAIKLMAREIFDLDPDAISAFFVRHFDFVSCKREPVLKDLATEHWTKKGLMHCLLFSHRITTCIADGVEDRIRGLEQIADSMNLSSELSEFLET